MNNYTEIKKNHIYNDSETIWMKKSNNRGLGSKWGKYSELSLRISISESVLLKAFGKMPNRITFAVSKTNCHQFIIGNGDETGYRLDRTSKNKYGFRISFNKIGGRLDYFKHIYGGESYDHVYLPDGAGVEFKIKELK